MKLRHFFLWFSLAAMLALAANAVFLWMIQRSFQIVVAEHDHREQAMTLINALRHETELLTRLVRAYTNTSETRYLTIYYDILAIRQGEKPLPEDYIPGAFWDMVLAGEIQPRFAAQAQPRSLSERMQSLGFSPLELDALAQVAEATEAIKAVDQIAFAATQGLYDPVIGEFVSDAQPDLAFANQQVNSQHYNRLRSALEKAVLVLSTMVNERTSFRVAEATASLQHWIYLAFASLVGTCLMVLAAGQVIRFRVLQPIQALSQAAARLAAGDYSTRMRFGTHPDTEEPALSKRGVQELSALAATFDSMAESIEQDIARRHQVQQDLQAAHRKAEDATRAKSMFLANMSHEIRTPMNAIIGMAHLALKTELKPQQQGYLRNIQNAARSLLAIINDILDFSKVEAGRLELEKAPFVLEEVVGNSLALLHQRAQEKDIELLFDTKDAQLLDRQCRLIGDALRLGQILTNLLSNAVKFTHQGAIRLTVECIEQHEQSVLLQFCVRDTGIGMSEAQLSRLFQEFTQADGSTTRKYGGTGLGLSISKKLVELMGGRIGVESREGQGSNFNFTARFAIAAPAPARDLPLPSANSKRLHGMRVLLVEDNAINQQLAVELMEHCGVEVKVAGHGQEALDRLAEVAPEHYHLVLMDLQMPIMDGYEATRRLRADPRYSALPVVAMTAHAMIEERDRCQAIGMNGHLGKPVEPEDLYALLRQHYTDPTPGGEPSGADISRQVATVAQGLSAEPAQSLPVIAGLDTAAGLRRTGARVDLYLQLLARFADDFADCEPTFRGCLAEGRWHEAEQLAHTLKGLAATLGAVNVHPAAAALEVACKEQCRERAQTALSALAPQLTPLVAELRQHISAQQATECRTEDSVTRSESDKIPDCLPRLQQLLHDCDSDAIDLWERHRHAFTCVLPPQSLERIGVALGNFEFDTASALLDALAGRLSKQ